MNCTFYNYVVADILKKCFFSLKFNIAIEAGLFFLSGDWD